MDSRLSGIHAVNRTFFLILINRNDVSKLTEYKNGKSNNSLVNNRHPRYPGGNHWPRKT